ncbi:MAG: hypothetical protein WDN69_15520 [Aliidongia sp.]
MAELVFSGTQGQQITLSTQWDANIGHCEGETVVLLEPDGQTQLYNHSEGCGSWDQSPVLTLPVGGTYVAQLLIAGPYSGTVILSASAPLVADSSIGAAVSVLPTTLPGQVAELVFSGTQGQQITLSTQWDANIGHCEGETVVLLEPDGQTQLYNHSEGCGSWDQSPVLTLPVGGTYVAQLLIAGPYSGTVILSASAPLVADSSIGAAVSVLPTTLPGQVAELVFSGTQGQQITLSTQWDANIGHCEGETVVLLEPDGQTQLYNHGEGCGSWDQSPVLTLPVSGTYVAQLLIAGPYSGTVTLSAAAPLAVSGAVGMSSSVHTTLPGEVAQVNFNGQAGQQIQLITVWGTNLAQCEGETVVLLEPDGQTQLYNHSEGCGNSDQSGTITLPVSGTYEWRFIPDGPFFDEVEFSLIGMPAGTTAELGSLAIANSSFEDNPLM